MSSEPKRIEFIAFTVRNGSDSEQGHWTPIGGAIPHKNGDGYTVLLDCGPLDGRIVLRTPKHLLADG